MEAEATVEAEAEPAHVVEDWYAPAEETTESTEAADGAPNAWGDETNGWTEAEPAAEAGDTNGTADAGDDVPRWAAGETPEGFPTSDDTEGGDPVDRGAIMAALEAAAEAVVAAESAAESADQAEAAADVAETAAELLVGRQADEQDYDPEAAAAMNARVDAGGYDTESFADRLAEPHARPWRRGRRRRGADDAGRRRRASCPSPASRASSATSAASRASRPSPSRPAPRASSCSTSPIARTSRSAMPSRPCRASPPA